MIDSDSAHLCWHGLEASIDIDFGGHTEYVYVLGGRNNNSIRV